MKSIKNCLNEAKPSIDDYIDKTETIHKSIIDIMKYLKKHKVPLDNLKKINNDVSKLMNSLDKASKYLEELK